VGDVCFWKQVAIYFSKESLYKEFGLTPNENGITTTVIEVKHRSYEGQDHMDIAGE
jgi:hypothetical protein